MRTYEFKFKDGRLFTGAVDKNGTEIYDGDRVIASNEFQEVYSEKGTVRYMPERAKFAVFYDTPDVGGRSNAVDGNNYNWDDFFELDEIAVFEEGLS